MAISVPLVTSGWATGGMRLTFTKRAGKHDDLLIERADSAPEAVPCPKQGIIPHDMVHYAVESSLAHRGFLHMAKDGDAAGFATQGGASEESIERLVESFQAEMWSGRVPAHELLATYELACQARGHPSVGVSLEDVALIRAALDDLTSKWADVAVNQSLILEF